MDCKGQGRRQKSVTSYSVQSMHKSGCPDASGCEKGSLTLDALQLLYIEKWGVRDNYTLFYSDLGSLTTCFDPLWPESLVRQAEQ